MSSAPGRPTGTAGTAQMKMIVQTSPPMTSRIGRSRTETLSSPVPFRALRRESLKVRTNSGIERTSEMNPPMAIAPAPT